MLRRLEAHHAKPQLTMHTPDDRNRSIRAAPMRIHDLMPRKKKLILKRAFRQTYPINRRVIDGVFGFLIIATVSVFNMLWCRPHLYAPLFSSLKSSSVLPIMLVAICCNFAPPVFVGWLFTVFTRKRLVAKYVRALAADGFCGSCLYPINNLPPNPDDCTTCPECSAAWKLPPPTQPPTTT